MRKLWSSASDWTLFPALTMDQALHPSFLLFLHSGFKQRGIFPFPPCQYHSGLPQWPQHRNSQAGPAQSPSQPARLLCPDTLIPHLPLLWKKSLSAQKVLRWPSVTGTRNRCYLTSCQLNVAKLRMQNKIKHETLQCVGRLEGTIVRFRTSPAVFLNI